MKQKAMDESSACTVRFTGSAQPFPFCFFIQSKRKVWKLPIGSWRLWALTLSRYIAVYSETTLSGSLFMTGWALPRHLLQEILIFRYRPVQAQHFFIYLCVKLISCMKTQILNVTSQFTLYLKTWKSSRQLRQPYFRSGRWYAEKGANPTMNQ